MKTSKYLLTLVIFFLTSTLLADTIYLKNGNVLNGQIVGQSRKKIRIRVGGAVRVIDKTLVRRVTYTDKAAEERRKAEAEKKKAEEEKRKAEEEARKKEADDKRRSAQEEARRKAELERQRKADAHIGPTWHGALVRSLIVPGWGQYYQGRNTMAYTIGGAFWLSAAGAAYMDGRYRSSRATYEDNATQFLITSPLYLSYYGATISDTSVFLVPGIIQTQNTIDSRQKMEDDARYANFLRFTAGALYVWNLADVVLFHPGRNQSMNMRSRYDGLDFSYQYRF